MRYALAIVAMLMAAPMAMAGDQPSCLQTHIAKPKADSKGVFYTKDALTTLRLELATTAAQREMGLMNRKEMGPCDGMAFFFPKARPQKFWMKNTHIPLDVMFVDEAGKIVAIINAKPLSEELVGPDTPITTVIEIAGGRAAKLGIATGDRVHYELQVDPKSLAQ